LEAAVTERAERREELKLLVEYIKLAASVAVAFSVLFVGLQWSSANEAAQKANLAANLALYQRMTDEWRNHLKTFVEHPQLRPYFEEMKELKTDDEHRQRVLALADVRLDVMDAVLTYAAMSGLSNAIAGWKNAFSSAFRTSTVLCARLRETESSYPNAQILLVAASCAAKAGGPR
jgi:hypothetical protein